MAAPKDHVRNKIYAAEQSFAADHPDQVVNSVFDMEARTQKVIRRVPFMKMILPRVCSRVFVERGMHRCPPTIEVRGSEVWTINVSNSPTMLEVFHSLAHGILDVRMSPISFPPGLIHDVEFVKLYLDLVRRFYDPTASPQRMKEVKGYLLDQKVKTSEKSPEARAAAKARWFEKNKLPSVREQLLKMREELREDEV